MDHDHPGRFLDYFAEDNIIPEFVRLFEGQHIPALAPYDLLFVLGGAQDTWQEEQFPYLQEEKAAIREWVLDRAKPYLGVCLGHQLLAAALGGEVAPADQPEVGQFEIAFTDAGTRHPFFSGLDPQQQVMQWHRAEVKRAPAGAETLARSTTTPVQALAIGRHALSTQFHCEFSPQTVAGWSSLPNYLAVLDRELGQGGYDRLKNESYPKMPAMARMTRQMYQNFKTVSGLVM